jgi:hypothetical protein
MYVSHAVRSIRDDPIPGEAVTLLLEADEEGSLEAIREAVEAVGGTVDGELRFGTLEVTVAHEDVAAACEVDGIASVETANTLVLDPDGAGEDVRPEE